MTTRGRPVGRGPRLADLPGAELPVAAQSRAQHVTDSRSDHLDDDRQLGVVADTDGGEHDEGPSPRGRLPAPTGLHAAVAQRQGRRRIESELPPADERVRKADGHRHPAALDLVVDDLGRDPLKPWVGGRCRRGEPDGAHGGSQEDLFDDLEVTVGVGLRDHVDTELGQAGSRVRRPRHRRPAGGCARFCRAGGIADGGIDAAPDPGSVVRGSDEDGSPRSVGERVWVRATATAMAIPIAASRATRQRIDVMSPPFGGAA